MRNFRDPLFLSARIVDKFIAGGGGGGYRREHVFRF